MKTESCDVLVLGGGPGGISAASRVALEGKKAIIINAGPLMGYGIDGAFRSKAGFEITREYLHTSYREDVFGKLSELDLSSVNKGIDDVSEKLTRMLKHRLDRLKIKLVSGKGSFVDSHTIEVNGKAYRGDYIVIGTGTRPRWLPGIPRGDDRVITSDEGLKLKKTPKSILILGAGVIGCEFASMFNAMGTEVHLVDTKPVIMSNEDEDISNFLENAFKARDIRVIRSSRYESMELLKHGVKTKLSTGEITTEMVFLAIGRSPCIDGVNIAASGVALDDRKYISTDQNSRTNIPHIYAVGDIGDRGVPSDLALVHVAEAEGLQAASSILGIKCKQTMDHVPYIIFTVPMLAGAGVTEAYARKQYGDVRVGKYPYARNHRAHAIHPPIGFVKLIVGPPGDDRILGVRTIGLSSDAMVGAASILIEQELPYTYLLESIFPHPSLLESLKGAAHIVAGDALQYEEGEELLLTEAMLKDDVK